MNLLLTMNNIVVLGNDHTNTLGLIQSLGGLGYSVYAAVWGLKTGIVKSSKYLKDLITGSSPENCIQAIYHRFKNETEKTIILCACDGAAIELERNKDLLQEKFLFEYTCGTYSISQLQEKNLQVKLALEAGFNTPSSIEITDPEQIPLLPPFKGPYIYKALKSVEGDKGDLTICKDWDELVEKAKITLAKTPRILVQQYINRDFEISILGCSLSNGDCIIPAIENKLTLFPQNVGLECLAYVDELKDPIIINPIKQLLTNIGYIGLFSVEMMHCKSDNKYYFTEINLRNDGANSFIRKYGVNLPLIHVNDLNNNLTDKIIGTNVLNPGFYIWEIHHFYSMLHHEISFFKWLREICKAKSFLVCDKHDIQPFIRQFTFPLINKFRKAKMY